MKKYFYWFGIIAPFIFIFTIILAGALIPHYNHVHNAISQIGILSTKQNLIIITPLFTLYNLFVIIFGFFIFTHYYKLTILNKLQSFIIIIIGFMGMIISYFPMDLIGSKLTILGFIHVSFTCLVTLLQFYVTLSFYFKNKNKYISIYSLITSCLILIMGSLTGFSYIYGMLPYFGLIERITFFSFLLWFFTISLYFKSSLKDNY
jgi:hypothetical membrane protein